MVRMIRRDLPERSSTWFEIDFFIYEFLSLFFPIRNFFIYHFSPRAKRAKKSGWGRVLPPYNVGPEEAEIHEIHDMRGEIQQEEMVPRSFKTKIQAVSNIIRHTEKADRSDEGSAAFDHPKQYATSHRSSLPYACGSKITISNTLHII